MELNAAQTKFVQELRTMLSLYKDNTDARLKTPATNLEWNAKKIVGEFNDPSVTGEVFARRTKADLELIAAALPPGAGGQAYAARAAGEVTGVFASGAAATTATAEESQPAASPVPAAPSASSDGAKPVTSATGSLTAAPVDIKSLLSQKADHAGEKLAWKTSVVDLLKLLGKDSSQSARHRYAVSLGFPEGEISKMPSAEFNDWLHGQLLSTLASNGGNLPSNIA